jgi:hypothetical protein
VFQLWDDATKDCVSALGWCHQRLCFSAGMIPPKIVFQRWNNATKDCVSALEWCHQRLCFSAGMMPPKIVFQSQSWYLIPPSVLHFFCVSLVKVLT